MRPIQQWSFTALIAAGASALVAVVALADGVNGFKVLSEIQPFATKAWVLAQQDSVQNDVRELRWDAIDVKASLTRAKLKDDQFKIIQLQDLIDSDRASGKPTDLTKKQLLSDLQSDIREEERLLDRLTCQLAGRYGQNAAASC